MAHEAQGLVLPESTDLECNICRQYFTEPKLLPCCHLLCRLCLTSLLESQPEAQCPTCLCPILEPGRTVAGKPWPEIVDGLPTDLAMAEHVEADRRRKTTRTCCMCREAVSTALCLECGDDFCNTCKNFHTRQAFAKSHSVRDFSCLTPDQLSSPRPLPCAAHADKPCDLFCDTHSLPICQVCFVSRHRQCPNVVDLQQKMDDSYMALDLLFNKLTTAELELDETMKRLDNHLLDRKNKTAAALAKMDTVCTHLKAAIDVRCAHVREEAEKAVSHLTQRVDSGKGALLKSSSNVTSHKRAVRRTMEAKRPDAVIPMTSLMATLVEEVENSTMIPDEDRTMFAHDIVVDVDELATIERYLETLGQIKLVSDQFTLSLTSPTPVVKSLKLSPKTDDSVVKAPIFLFEQEKKLCFGDNTGCSVRLSEDKTTATMVGQNNDGDGIVIGKQPMVTSCLYQVKVSYTERASGWYIPVGVVLRDPATQDIPKWAKDWVSAVVIWNDGISVYGCTDDCITIGSQLLDLPQDSRVGVLIDDWRSLHLYINGVDQGVAANNLPDRCYPFFELHGQTTQITALPVEPIV